MRAAQGRGGQDVWTCSELGSYSVSDRDTRDSSAKFAIFQVLTVTRGQ